METEKFLQQLSKEKKIPPVLLLVGEEDYYIDKVIGKVKQLWCGGKEEQELSVTVLSADPSPLEFVDVVTSMPFFSEHSLVLVPRSKLFASGKQAGDAAGNKEEYIKLLAQIPEHCRVIFQCDKADKRTKLFKTFATLGQIVECEKIKSYKVKDWLLAAAKEKNCRWEAAALDLVVNYLALAENISLYMLEQEVEKISLYAGSRTTWTSDDVEQVFSRLDELSGFALTEAMAAGDVAKALLVLREQTVRGVHMLKIAGLIAFQLRRLWKARQIVSSGGGRDAVASQMGIPPFFAAELVRQCQKLSEEKIKNALLSLSDISREVHLGGRGMIHLEEVVIEFCQ